MMPNVIIHSADGPQLVMPWRDALALLATLKRPEDYWLVPSALGDTP